MIKVKTDDKTKNEIRKYGFIISMMIYPATLFVLFYLGVNLNSIKLAFQKVDILGNATFNGFKNFEEFFSLITTKESMVGLSIYNSLRMFIINLIICMPLYLIFSFYIYKKFSLSKVYRLIIMVPAIVSGFIICLLFKKFVELALPSVMASVGYEDFPQLLSDPKYTFQTSLFYMIWISFSTSLLVYPNAMNAIDDSIIEASKIDGVNLFQEFWYVVIPLIYPTISTFLITGLAGIFLNQGPLLAFYMYEAPPETFNFAYYMLVEVMKNPNTSQLKYPLLSAMGIIITIISAFFTFLLKSFLDKRDPTRLI